MWQITLFALAQAAYMVMDFYVPIKYVLPTFENIENIYVHSNKFEKLKLK